MEIIHRGGCAFRKSVLLSRCLKRKGKTKHTLARLLWGSPLGMFPPPGMDSHRATHAAPQGTGKIHATQPAGGRAHAVARSPGTALGCSYGRAELRNPSHSSDLGTLGSYPCTSHRKGRVAGNLGGGGPTKTYSSSNSRTWSSLNSSFLNF